MGDVVAAVSVAEEGFSAVRGPLYRPADLLRRPDADRLLRVNEDLGAEAAADIRGDHPELVLGRDADEGREHEAGDVRILARGVEGVGLLARLVLADRRAWLNRVRDEAVVDEIELRHLLRLGGGGVDGGLVAEMPAMAGVFRGDFVHLDWRGLRLRGVGDGWQRGVFEGDRLGRIPRLRHRL